MSIEKLKVFFIQMEGYQKELTPHFFTSLQEQTALTERAITKTETLDNISTEINNHNVVLIDGSLGEKAVEIAAITSKKARTIVLSQNSEKIFIGENANLYRKLCSLGNWLEINKDNSFPWKKILFWILNPQTTQRIHEFSGGESYVCTNKIQNNKEIGWALDVILKYEIENNGNNPKSFSNLRLSVIAIVEYAISKIKDFPMENVDIELSITKDYCAYSIKFKNEKINTETLALEITEADNSLLFQAWQNSQIFQILNEKENNTVEIRGISSFTNKAICKSNDMLIERNHLKANPEAMIAKTQNINFRPFDSILSELPEEIRNRSSQNIILTASEEKNDDTIAKILYSKSQLIQELSGRMEDSQKQANNRQKKINSILTEVKMELGNTKKELTQAKNKIKILENKIEKDIAPSEASVEETEKQLSEINSSLKKASAEKTTVEEKLALAERKINLQEKKYTKVLQQLQQKEKELNETKPIILKLNKELEANQSTLKQQAQVVPVQIGNEDYDKKIKMLSSKVYEYQQKEAELQVQLKKSNLKLEQAEIGRKSGKNENDGKIKAMERQIEQAKVKEKDLIKKIEELNAIIKKSKTGKAA
jgi:hypothetical protein